MTAWLASLRDRPIAPRERHGALALVLIVLLASTLALALARAASPRQTSEHTGRTSTTVTASPRSKVAGSDPPNSPSASTHEALFPVAARTSRAFLAGYLAYLYGRAPASRIKDANRTLIVSLEAHPPRVSPAMRRRVAHVLGLRPALAPAGLIGVQATVNDGELVNYTIGLLLDEQDGRLLVLAVDGEG